MKIAVFSDSHGKTELMVRAVREQSPDVVIHLGDHADDTQALRFEFPALTIYNVRGNCDMFSQEPEKLLLTLEGKRILAMHGHAYRVKLGLQNALYAAREANADILLFGHTHIPLCDESGGILILNPGTIGEGSFHTYGVIEINKGKALCRTVRADKTLK